MAGPATEKTITVADVREAIKGLPGDMPVRTIIPYNALDDDFELRLDGFRRPEGKGPGELLVAVSVLYPEPEEDEDPGENRTFLDD